MNLETNDTEYKRERMEVRPSDLSVRQDAGYGELVSRISATWDDAKSKAAISINTELLEANWRTGKYIVEFEQGGNERAQYGANLINRLAKDLTILREKKLYAKIISLMKKEGV